jgi:hypothetical protein
MSVWEHYPKLPGRPLKELDGVYGTDGPLPCSQELVSRLHPEPAESSLRPQVTEELDFYTFFNLST